MIKYNIIVKTSEDLAFDFVTDYFNSTPIFHLVGEDLVMVGFISEGSMWEVAQRLMSVNNRFHLKQGNLNLYVGQPIDQFIQ